MAKKKGDDDEYVIIYGYDDGDDDMPEGCRACGGPWPSCQSSCSLYDDD